MSDNKDPWYESEPLILLITIIAFFIFVIAAAIVVADCPTHKPIRLDSSDKRPADPKTPRYTTLDTADGYLYISNGKGVLKYDGRQSKAANNLVKVGDVCLGDYDWICPNMSFCSDCSNGAMSCGVCGSYILDAMTLETNVEVESQSKGAFIFKHGGHEYIAATGWTIGSETSCGTPPRHSPTLWMRWGDTWKNISCIDLGQQQSIQMLELPQEMLALNVDHTHAASSLVGQDILAGTKLPGDRVALVTSDNRLRVFEIQGSEDSLRLNLVPGPQPAAGSNYGRGFEAWYDGDRCLLATSSLNESALWSCDLKSLQKLYDLPHPANHGGIASFSSDGTKIYIARMAGQQAYLYDISVLSIEPVLIESFDINMSKQYRAHYDAEPYRGNLELGDWSIQQPVDISGCSGYIFEDGFESGDTSAWE